MLVPDNHVHSQFSYDTGAAGSMELTCGQAVAIGLPSVAFTEHVDFTRWADEDAGAGAGLTIDRPRVAPLDVAGYLESIDRCRTRFPGLRIISGLEAGEPHLFTASVADVLGKGAFERVLGSLHALGDNGRLAYAHKLVRDEPQKLMTRYFEELLRMVAGSDVFEILAHMDYPRRAWPAHRPFAEADYEEEYRTVFRALAGAGRVLEFNTSSPLISVDVLRWWRQEGGAAVSFGSDAHRPAALAQQFDVATQIAGAAGFGPGRDPFDYWRA